MRDSRNSTDVKEKTKAAVDAMCQAMAKELEAVRKDRLTFTIRGAKQSGTCELQIIDLDLGPTANRLVIPDHEIELGVISTTGGSTSTVVRIS